MRALPKVIDVEDVVKYEHDLLNKVIRVYIGKGTRVAEVFTLEPSIGLEVRLIEGPAYEALVNGGASGELKIMDKAELWQAIDDIAAAPDVEIISEEKVRNAKLAK